MSEAAPEHSMEEVLASIKRVMARDPVPDLPPRRRSVPTGVPDDVLELRAEDQEDDGLTSSATVEASRRTLQSLATLEPSPAVSGSGAVESWAADLMKPMLREWLDEHLPAIVEAAVEREVRRITRG